MYEREMRALVGLDSHESRDVLCSGASCLGSGEDRHGQYPGQLWDDAGACAYFSIISIIQLALAKPSHTLTHSLPLSLSLFLHLSSPPSRLRFPLGVANLPRISRTTPRTHQRGLTTRATSCIDHFRACDWHTTTYRLTTSLYYQLRH